MDRMGGGKNIPTSEGKNFSYLFRYEKGRVYFPDLKREKEEKMRKRRLLTALKRSRQPRGKRKRRGNLYSNKVQGRGGDLKRRTQWKLIKRREETLIFDGVGEG